MKMAPEGFMIKILTQLDALLYKPGDVIIRNNDEVDELVVIGKGSCDLFGYYKVKDAFNEENDKKVLISRLPRQSWFGDFQIFLDIKSTF